LGPGDGREGRGVSKKPIKDGYHWSVETGDYHRTFLSEHKHPRKAFAVTVEAFCHEPPSNPGVLTCVQMLRPGQDWAVRIYIDTASALRKAGYEIRRR
jgi:hypothetical protein